jgi:hypothetical protein
VNELESGPRDAIGEFAAGWPLTKAAIAPKGAAPDRLRCRSCGGVMLIIRIIPRQSGLPELRTYECSACHTLQTFEDHA